MVKFNFHHIKPRTRIENVAPPPQKKKDIGSSIVAVRCKPFTENKEDWQKILLMRKSVGRQREIGNPGYGFPNMTFVRKLE